MKTRILGLLMVSLTLVFLFACKETSITTALTDSTTTAITTKTSVPTTATEATTTTTANDDFLIANPGFESGDLSGWTVLSGEAFASEYVTNASRIGSAPYNKAGNYLYGAAPEALIGKMRSESFRVSGSGYVSFLLGGGYLSALCYVSVVEESTHLELFRIGNEALEIVEHFGQMTRHYADLSPHLGKEVYFLVVDDQTANGGYLVVDDFISYYASTPNTDQGILATDIKPSFPDLTTIPNSLDNGDFATRTLEGWTISGEKGVFRDSHINESGRLSNRPDETKIGVLRSPAFKVSGKNIISFRLGATKHADLTYLSIKEVGTNIEVYRTYSDRWIDAHEEATHLYYIDLGKHSGQALYLEFVDNSRGDWGLLTIEDIITYYDSDPVVTDEIGWNLLNEIDHRRDYDNMRDYIDPLIASISDEAERITFQKTFYSTVDGIKNNKGDWPGVLHYKDNGMTFVYTGDIHAMWLRDSSAQVLPYLQFMEMDQDVKHMVRGLLLQQFEQIRRDPYANAFNPDGSVFEKKFEIDSLCYPLWLADKYYSLTADDTIFDYFFELTVRKVIETLRNEQNHSDHNYRIENEYDRSVGSNDFNPESKLIWSGYRPSDDVCHYKYFISGNMFAVATLEKMAILFENLGLDDELRLEMEDLAEEVRTAIETYGVYDHPVYGKIYVFETTGLTSDSGSAAEKILADAANIPSLLAAPWLGYLEVDDQVYQNTRAFILSDDNPYYHEGTYASGIGDPHDSIYHENPALPVVWHMALAMQGLTATDPDEIDLMLAYMKNTTAGTYVMHEAFNANNPSQYTRDFFTWPCALYAELYLRNKLNINLDQGVTP
ncbi:MAG: glycoside hydrolase family 125 protein [Candidatus Izemoplasmatales bacterium]|jgi:meiotically up-regulated gene 157 (Mug157) protein